MIKPIFNGQEVVWKQLHRRDRLQPFHRQGKVIDAVLRPGVASPGGASSAKGRRKTCLKVEQELLNEAAAGALLVRQMRPDDRRVDRPQTMGKCRIADGTAMDVPCQKVSTAASPAG